MEATMLPAPRSALPKFEQYLQEHHLARKQRIPHLARWAAGYLDFVAREGGERQDSELRYRFKPVARHTGASRVSRRRPQLRHWRTRMV
jgi:hypothetical protein